jgi:hypothetical protein
MLKYILVSLFVLTSCAPKENRLAERGSIDPETIQNRVKSIARDDFNCQDVNVWTIGKNKNQWHAEGCGIRGRYIVRPHRLDMIIDCTGQDPFVSSLPFDEQCYIELAFIKYP